MKKYKLVLGATVLAIAGIVAGRASGKFATPTALYFTSAAGTVCTQIASAITATANKLTTNTANGVAAFLRTGTTNHRLFNATVGGACVTPLNIK